jgi:hypothetical protein
VFSATTILRNARIPGAAGRAGAYLNERSMPIARLEYCWDGWIDYCFECGREALMFAVLHMPAQGSDKAQAASAWIGIIVKTTSRRERKALTGQYRVVGVLSVLQQTSIVIREGQICAPTQHNSRVPVHFHLRNSAFFPSPPEHSLAHIFQHGRQGDHRDRQVHLRSLTPVIVTLLPWTPRRAVTLGSEEKLTPPC